MSRPKSSGPSKTPTEGAGLALPAAASDRVRRIQLGLCYALSRGVAGERPVDCAFRLVILSTVQAARLIRRAVPLIVIGAALCLCVWAIVREDSTTEDKKWAVPLLTAIVTGLLGYVVGRGTK